MNKENYEAMRESILASMRQFPTCRIANCICNEFIDEWKPECYCMGHFYLLDRAFGKGNWTLADYNASAKAGKPIKKP